MKLHRTIEYFSPRREFGISNLRFLISNSLRLPVLCGFVAVMCAVCFQTSAAGQNRRSQARRTRTPQNISLASSRGIPDSVMLRILESEDVRRWDADLSALLSHASAAIRRRAAVAAGRIGDERSAGALMALLRADRDPSVRAAAALALGEIESAASATALIENLDISRAPQVRARAVEALGKIAAALPQTQADRKREIGASILSVLDAEAGRRSSPSEEVILSALTAVMRARPENATSSIANFLSAYTPAIRATALNSLARLRARDANERVRELLNDSDSIVRANAARVLGATEDRASVDAILSRFAVEEDARTRVSIIRALGAIKDARAAAPIIARSRALFEAYQRAPSNGGASRPAETSELLELASALGNLLLNAPAQDALAFLRSFREAEGARAPEIEIAFARIAPAQYLREPLTINFAQGANESNFDWRKAAAVVQGLGEIGRMTSQTGGNSAVSIQADAQLVLREFLMRPQASQSPAPAALALPDALRALAAFRPPDLETVLISFLEATDVFARQTAAELLSEIPANERIRRALVSALPSAMRETANDATLAILDALGKQQHAEASAAVQTALASGDHLVRRRAVSLLRAAGAGDFSQQIGTVSSTFTREDYARALRRRASRVRAVVSTDKGVFTIELLPDDAPLTVHNFIRLASGGGQVFDNTVFHRVVPNFVIQGGDYTRGDGNGGPPYQIRCEINDVPYARGAVGMALSGKDTGGSQWFVTHSPQPHLDGGYTVFGRVTEGMDVVDRITRGDRILSVRIVESATPPRTGTSSGGAPPQRRRIGNSRERR
jgi:cyclophilin family peptidyl-prolyl cis-trans isomerase/HEAT repeat protein